MFRLLTVILVVLTCVPASRSYPFTTIVAEGVKLSTKHQGEPAAISDHDTEQRPRKSIHNIGEVGDWELWNGVQGNAQ